MVKIQLNNEIKQEKSKKKTFVERNDDDGNETIDSLI